MVIGYEAGWGGRILSVAAADGGDLALSGPRRGTGRRQAQKRGSPRRQEPEMLLSSEQLKKTTFQIPLAEGYTSQAIQADLTVYRAIQPEIQQLEQSAFNAVKLSDQYTILQTAPRGSEKYSV